VGALAQLQSLALVDVTVPQPDTIEQLLLATSELTVLTQLTLSVQKGWQMKQVPPPAAAFTALTTSKHLCSLQLGIQGEDCTLLTPESGPLLPQQRIVDLQHTFREDKGMPLRALQLQRLCGLCPAVQSLAFVFHPASSHADLLPLLQLSALTSLQVFGMSEAAAATAVDISAQLTRLRQLNMSHVGKSWTPRSLVGMQPQISTLLKLTTLRALEQLQVDSTIGPNTWVNKVSLSTRPSMTVAWGTPSMAAYEFSTEKSSPNDDFMTHVTRSNMGAAHKLCQELQTCGGRPNLHL
jgi:hypothetical protein